MTQGRGRVENLIALLVIVLLAVLTGQRNTVYRTELTLLSATLARSPLKQRVHFNYGCELSRAGCYEKALQQFSISASLPRAAYFRVRDLLIEQGKAFYYLKRYAEAEAAWRSALAFHPGDAEVLNDLGAVLLKLGRIDEARSCLEMAERGGVPDLQASILVNLAAVSFASGDERKAWQHVQEALANSRDLPQLYLDLADALADAGRYRDAESYAERYLNVSRDEHKAEKVAQALESGAPRHRQATRPPAASGRHQPAR